MSVLQHTTSIENGCVRHNGRDIFHSRNVEFDLFSRELYTHIELGYPKFFKMDGLCKLALLGAEILLKNTIIHPDKTAICLGTNSGSLQSDTLHQQSIQKHESYFPSPAVFVYTLPNIMLGEICIRHGINGENSCFVMPEFDKEFFEKKMHLLFNKEIYDTFIFGWVEFTPENYQCEFLLNTQE